MTKNPSANAAIHALRKAGVKDRLAGKIPGGSIRVLIYRPDECEKAVEVLAARFPEATVYAEDSLTVRIVP
jgi:hypothetical protein